MKKMVVWLMILFTAGGLNAQNVGINFENLTEAQALQKAQTSGRRVFVDVWGSKKCPVCVVMNKEVYPQKACGDYFNSTFVNVAYDVDDPKYAYIMEKYRVDRYPTYIIMNPDGSEYVRILGTDGTLNPDNFVRHIQKGIHMQDLYLELMAGNRDKVKFKECLEGLRAYGRDKSVHMLMDKMFTLMSVKELCEPENWKVIAVNLKDTRTDLWRFVIDNREEFVSHLGKEVFEEKVSEVVRRIATQWNIPYEQRVELIPDLIALEDSGLTGSKYVRMTLEMKEIKKRRNKDEIDEAIRMLGTEVAQLPERYMRQWVVFEFYELKGIMTAKQERRLCLALENVIKQTPEKEKIMYRDLQSHFSDKKKYKTLD